MTARFNPAFKPTPMEIHGREMPEVGSIWTDFNGVPHHVTACTKKYIEGNSKGGHFKIPLEDWHDQMEQFSIDF